MAQEKSHNVYKSRGKLLVDNFMAGIAWGLGTVIGATIVVALIGFVIARTQQLPLVGDVIYSIAEEVNRAGQRSDDS